MMELEKEDSGIDSDSAIIDNRRRRLRRQGFMQLSETSGSEGDTNSPCRFSAFWRNGRIRELDENHFPRVNYRANTPWPEDETEECDRGSPPLYEVELTASDEEDDASVLELVIPMQSRRYTCIDPKNTTTKILCTILCCFPK
ncbi:hypothetical protein EVAR_77161_1 [Eumeta japonica]|uniref:Uncharacterized protein n=1 Tax=Eumeta variegata TaxID=151549 RepID=A0A4C1T1X4_EUMVA|nr:hypothetical protein EVAR_77161_1 [Eumeta japonica]